MGDAAAVGSFDIGGGVTDLVRAIGLGEDGAEASADVAGVHGGEGECGGLKGAATLEGRLREVAAALGEAGQVEMGVEPWVGVEPGLPLERAHASMVLRASGVGEVCILGT